MMESVNQFINIHSHQLSPKDDVAIINIFPEDNIPAISNIQTYFSVGIHPWYINNDDSQREKLKYLIEQKKVIAIGECGMDIYSPSNMKEQEDVFRFQIELSEINKLPLIIHCVRAFNDLIRIKKQVKPEMPWILHGFNSNIQIIKQCLANGLLFSFGKSIMLDNSNTVKHINSITVDFVFLETDNSTHVISEIYEKYSQIRKLPIETTMEIISRNFHNYFAVNILELTFDFLADIK
jgi:TatD DNase family protein